MSDTSKPAEGISLTQRMGGKRKVVAPWMWASMALLFSLLLSVAIGPVRIPPSTVVRMLADQLGLAKIETDWPATFATILFEIRLPQTILIALTGMALGGSGAAYQGL
jgi:iron complex transport system permease protein